jgi:hypothetical protein
MAMRQSGLPYNAKGRGRGNLKRFPASKHRGHKSNRRKYYSGGEVLNLAAVTVLSAAEFSWKQGAVVVQATGLETVIQNAGKAQVIRLLASRIKNAERTMSNNVSTGIYSDGSGTGGKQITGLQSLVADAPSTGTVGGINRANHSFWRNQTYDFSDESVTASKTTISKAMQELWIDCSRGSDKTNLIVGGKTYYQFFWESLTDLQRYTQSEMGSEGFSSGLRFDTAEVIYDGDSGLAATRMYFLNTEYLYWRPHTARNMVPLPRRESFNQDAVMIPIVFAGNLTCSNAARQGLLVA